MKKEKGQNQPFPEVVQRLRARWTSTLISQIVTALNQGLLLQPILEGMPSDPDLPAASGNPDLRGIDLSFQNLRGPWTFTGNERARTGVTLRRADLCYSNLNWTVLLRADLRDALFCYACMRDAELILADCSGADFTGSDLQNAWFLDTRLTGARISPEQLKTRRNLGQLDFDYHAFEL